MIKFPAFSSLIPAFSGVLKINRVPRRVYRWCTATRLRKVLSSILAILIVLTSIRFAFFKPKDTLAWWNDNWQYRVKTTITEQTGGSLSNFQVAITLDTATLITAGKMKSDCADIRVYDGTNTQPQDFWVERCNNSTTRIWIKQSFSASEVKVFYTYYGNPGAVSAAVNGSLIFDHFEDFSGLTDGADITSVSNWTKDVADGSTYTIQDEKLKMYHPASAPNEAKDYALYTHTSEITSDTVVEADVTVADSNNWDFMNVLGDANSTIATVGTTAFWSAINNESWQGYTGSWSAAQTLTVNTTYTLGASLNIASDLAKMYVDGTYKIDRTFNDIGTTGLQKIYFGNYGYGSTDTTWYVDNIKVRKYATSEPTSNNSAEEAAPGPVAFYKFDEGYSAPESFPLTKNEQQINIVDQTYYFLGSSYNPTDNSLGIIHWDPNKYSGASVYFEVVMRAPNGGDESRFAALHDTAGNIVNSSIVSCSACGTSFVRYRTNSPVTLASEATDYTVRVRTTSAFRDVEIKAARLIIIQTDATKITDTQTQIEVGNNEKQTSNTATQLTDKKIWSYDSSKFNPVPTNTAYFEASLRSSPPTIEQQINIVDRTYSTNSGTYGPSDNSLGIFHWDTERYSGATLYFEANISGNCGQPFYAAIHTLGGSIVTDSAVNTANAAITRVRSGSFTLTDNTDYTVLVRQNACASNGTIKAARLIIIQSDATKITDTQTQIEVGNNETTTQTSYTNLTDKKIYRYDATVFNPAPTTTAYFEATLSNDTAGQTAYAALYTDGASCTSQVTDSEVSVTGTTWTLIRSSQLTLADDTDYSVCIKTSANTARIANAKIILDQTAAGGITALETVQQQVNTLNTDSGTTYDSDMDYLNFFNPDLATSQRSFAGGTLTYNFEATMKVSAGTGEVRLKNDTDGTAISGSELSSTSTSYELKRTASPITANLPQYPQNSGKNLDTQVKNTAGTTSVANSWLIVQVSNLATGGVTAYADLYDTTSGQVANSEVTTTSSSWTLVRSNALTLTSGHEYVVRLSSSNNGAAIHLANAKIILDQTAAGGITALETVQQQVNTLNTDSGTTYDSDMDYLNFYNPDLNTTQRSFAGGTLTYHFEATMKVSAGTGEVRLKNDTDGTAISGSELTSTSLTYELKRTASPITANLPQHPQNSGKNLDTQAKNTAGTTSVANSWLIVQVSNLATGGVTAYADLYNLTDTVQVADSEVSTTSSSWTRIRSNLLTLATGKQYVVRLKSSNNDVAIYLANAKIILDQSDSLGIKAVETVQQQINTAVSRTSASYADQDFLNQFNPDNFHIGQTSIFFETTMKTSTGGGANDAFAILKNDTGGSTITGSEISTDQTSYTRVRTASSITANMPTSSVNMDTQIKNQAAGTTTVSNSWLIIQNGRSYDSVTHDSTQNQLHGNVSGITWKASADCHSENCLSFDGTNDYVKVYDDPKLDFAAAADFTLTGWFKHATTNGTDTILAKYEATGSDGGYKVYMNSSGQIVFGVDDDNTFGPDDAATSSQSYADNSWHHFAALKDGTSSIELYIDGVRVGRDASIAATGTLANNDHLYMGIDGDGTSNPWQGNLDEIKIYPYLRTADEIKTDFALGSSARGTAVAFGLKDESFLTNNLALYWKLDETSANTCDDTNDACDSSGNDNHARWEGNATSAAGKFAAGIDLDGTSDQVATSSARQVPSSWLYKRQIVFNNSTSTEDLNNFPVLISLNSSRVDYSNTQNSGQDIRFYDSDEKTPLPHEIEKWDETGTSYVWVNVPNIPSGSTTDYIWMYYGNDGVSDGQNPTGVWNNNFTGIWHLNETSGLTAYDSTSNDRDLTYGASPTLNTSGQIDGATGPNAATRTLWYTGTSDFTLEGWVKWLNDSSGTATIIYNGNGGADGYGLIRANGSCGSGSEINILNGGLSCDRVNSTTNFPANTWTHIVIVRDTGGTWRLYKDGVQIHTGSGAPNTPTGNFSLGASTFHTDEVRLSNTTRSADWIEATHLTSTDTFISSYGTQTNVDNNNKSTLAAWVNADTLGASDRVILARGNDGTGYGWVVKNDAANPGRLKFSSDGGTNYGLSNATLTTGSWYHVAMAVDGTATKLFVNGAFDSQVTNNDTLPGTGNISAGADDDGGNGWDGKIDEVRLYNRTLSAVEVSRLYNWAPGPVAHWKMDEGSWSGNIAVNDSSGNLNSLTHKGNASIVNGKYGNGGTFDGTGDYLCSDANSDGTCDDDGDLDVGTGSFTLTGWFKHAPIATNPDYLVVKAQAGTNAGYKVYMANDGDIVFEIDDDSIWGPDYSVTTTAATYDDGAWHHFAAVRNADSTITISIDGVQIASTPIAATATLSNDDPFYIGIDDNASSNPWDGQLDDIKLYNYTRTQAQIVEDMNAGHPAGGSPVASPIIYWKLDDLQGNAKNSGSGGSSMDGMVSSVDWNPPDLGCKINGCADLSGGLDYISAGDPSFFDSLTQMTISLWLDPSSLATGKSIVSKTNLDAATQNTFNVATDSSNSDEIRVYIASDVTDLSNYFTTSNFDLTANTLTHLAVVYDGSLSAGERVKVYKNGVRMAGSVTGTINTSLTSSSSNLKMGDTDRSINTGLLGRYDEFKIYNFALSDPERLIDFNAGSATSLGGVLGLQNAEGLGTNTQRAGYWKMDENTGTTNVYDYSGLERTMTMTNFNSSDWVPGKFGTSLNFDGSSKYLNRASVVLTSQNSISFTAWVKPDNTNTGTIYMQGTTGANFPYRAINYESGAIRFRSTNDAGTVQDAVDASTGTLTVGAWNFIAVVKGSTTIAYYVNGIKSTTTVANSGTYANEAHSSIGVLRRSSNTQYFDGVVDEIQLFSKSVNDLEAAYLLDRAGPVLWYKLDECSGPTINNSAPISSGGDAGLDGTATANTGNNVGTCGGTAGDMWADGATGKWNASLAFDGTDDYVETADNDQLDFDDAVDFTLEAWINRDSFANDHTVIAKKTDQSNSTDGYIIYIDGTTDDVNFVASQAGGSTNTHTINGLTTITSSGWYHIVVVWDDDQPAGTTIYVNGKEDKESTSGSQSAVAGMINTNTFRLGSESDGGNEFDGRIDNVKIYRYAMPTSLIKRLYNEGSAQRFGPAEGSP